MTIVSCDIPAFKDPGNVSLRRPKMNGNYDRRAAVAELDAMYSSDKRDKKQSTPLLSTVDLSKFDVCMAADVPYWKFLEYMDSDTPMEGMFRVKGILCATSLPPIKNKSLPDNNHGPKDMLKLKQRVTLTGLGSPSFERNVRAVEEIENLFTRRIDADGVVPNVSPCFEDHLTIHAENRYFTERRLVPTLEALPFVFGVDENGILGSHDPQHIIHCDENRVDYVANVNGGNYATHPKFFQCGDLVEALVSFVGIPIKQQRIKFMVVLRGLCLLSSGIRKESRVKAVSFKYTENLKLPVNVKRRAGYLPDEEGKLVKRLKESVSLQESNQSL